MAAGSLIEREDGRDEGGNARELSPLICYCSIYIKLHYLYLLCWSMRSNSPNSDPIARRFRCLLSMLKRALAGCMSADRVALPRITLPNAGCLLAVRVIWERANLKGGQLRGCAPSLRSNWLSHQRCIALCRCFVAVLCQCTWSLASPLHVSA